MSISRIASVIAMLFIVGILCLVATPKNLIDSIACAIYESKVCKASDPVPNQKPTASTDHLSNQSYTNSDITTIAKMTMESVDAKYANLKESQDRLFSVIAALGALMTFLGFKGFDSFYKSKEQADAAAKKAEEVQKFLNEQYEIDNRAEFMVIEAATLRNDADLYANISRNKKEDLLNEKYYSDQIFRAKQLLEDALELDTKNTLINFRALGVLGNINHRLEEYRQAKDCSARIIKLAEKKGLSSSLDAIDAHFNYACYAAKMAETLHKTGKSEDINKAVDLGKDALNKIRYYLIYEGFDAVNSEKDLEFLRIQMRAEYDAVLAEKKKSTT